MSTAEEMPFRILTAPEVAAILRVSTETVRRLHRRGALPALPCGALRFTLGSVARFIERNDPDRNEDNEDDDDDTV